VENKTVSKFFPDKREIGWRAEWPNRGDFLLDSKIDGR